MAYRLKHRGVPLTVSGIDELIGGDRFRADPYELIASVRFADQSQHARRMGRAAAPSVWNCRVFRNRWIEHHPRLRAAHKAVHLGSEPSLIIQCSRSDAHELLGPAASCKQRRAAARTKAAPHHASLLPRDLNYVLAHFTLDRQGRFANQESRREGGAAGPLAVRAMAVHHRQGLLRADITNRAAGTSSTRKGHASL